MPGELLNMFGITMLTNDSFTETKDVKCISGATGSANTYTWEPFVSILPGQINFDYFLCDKKIDRAIHFCASYFSTAEQLKTYDKFSIQTANDDDAEIILLNDGSTALVTDRDVTFSYNGVAYRIWFDHDGRSSSIELFKQVLDDLGVL